MSKTHIKCWSTSASWIDLPPTVEAVEAGAAKPPPKLNPVEAEVVDGGAVDVEVVVGALRSPPSSDPVPTPDDVVGAPTNRTIFNEKQKLENKIYRFMVWSHYTCLHVKIVFL